MLGKHTLDDSSQPQQAKFAKPNFSLKALSQLDHSATCNLFAYHKDVFNALHKSTDNETDKALTGIHLCNAVNSYCLDNNLNSMINYLMEGNGVSNRDAAMFIAFNLIEKYITPSNYSLQDRLPLKGDALKKFLENQLVEEAKPTSESEGLYFKTTASREKQLEDFAKGIISRYSTFLLQLNNRAHDSPLFEIRGPVGSGKTHFLLNATKEIAKKLLSNNNWLEDEFNEIWDNNYINGKDQKPPTDWRKNLIESIEKDVKIFASQRNELSWNIEFQNLSAFEYIAAMLAIHLLSPKGRFKLDNFKTTPLDLDSILDLIRDKFWKVGKLPLIEFCIDEIQLLIEGNDRSKPYELVRALHSTSSRRTDLLLIPVIGGTTFPSNDEDAQNDMNFVSLSGVANYIISLTPLMISNTIDLIKSDYFDEYKKLMSIGIQELANLLLLIGPFPRCVEMLVRGLKKNNDIIIASELYKTVKNKLLLKYSTKKESMIVNNAREIVEILRHILEGRAGLKEAIVQKALTRGLISYQKSGTISIIFVYLHIAICDNSILKAEFEITFLDNYFDALLRKGETHVRLMEDLVASFITLKARIYHSLGQHSVKADTFFTGATLGTKMKDIILQLDKNMNYRYAKHCTDDKLSDIKTIELLDGSMIDMTQNPTALVIGNQWTRGDGIMKRNRRVLHLLVSM